MPVHLNRFRSFVESSPDARISIQADGSHLQVQKNGFFRRLTQFFSSKGNLAESNKATALAFYSALRDEFGEVIASQAVKDLKGYQIKNNGLEFQGSCSITPRTIKAGIQIACALRQRVSSQPSVLNLGWKEPNPSFDIAKAESIFNESKISQNWKNAQKHLLNSRPDDLKLLIQYRQYVVDSIVRELQEAHPGFKANSVGSTALTSDYDITFQSEHQDAVLDGASSAAVSAFNKRFKEIFLKESGVVFDTNVYAHNYETGQVFMGEKNLLVTALKEDQHVAALLKLRKGISPDQWLKLQDDSIAKLGAKGVSELEKSQLLKRFEEADAIYALGVAHTLAELAKNPALKVTEVSVQKLSVQAQESLQGLEGTPSYTEVLAQFTGPIALQKLEDDNPDAVLQIRNRLYEMGLAELNSINTLLLDNPNSTALHAAQQHQISLCLFYAAEAYHTEGAITHVVEAMQAKRDVQLDSSQLCFSILEQIGDAQLHAHDSYSTTGAKWISQAAKYLGRVFDAMERLGSGNQSTATNLFATELQSILLGSENPYINTFTSGDLALLLNLLGQSVKRNAIDIKDEAVAKQITGILQKANDRIIPAQVRGEIELALTAFNRAQASDLPPAPYEIKNTSYATEAESGLAELFQTTNSAIPSFIERKDALTARVQEEVISAHVPAELEDVRRYFQALPNTQLFG